MAPESGCAVPSTPGAPITSVVPSLLIVIESPNAVFNDDPSLATPVMVCASANELSVLPSLACEVFMNISTLPALPGASELTASMSPLSFASTLCPNLCPEPPSGASIAVSDVHVSYVDPSAPTPQVYMYTLPVSVACPGAETNRYLSGVVLVDSVFGSEILCAQPKLRSTFELDPSVGAEIVFNMLYWNKTGSQTYILIRPESMNLVLPSGPIALANGAPATI